MIDGFSLHPQVEQQYTQLPVYLEPLAKTKTFIFCSMIALIHIFKIMQNDENYLVELKKSVFYFDKRFDVQDTVNWKHAVK